MRSQYLRTIGPTMTPSYDLIKPRMAARDGRIDQDDLLNKDCSQTISGTIGAGSVNRPIARRRSPAEWQLTK